MKDGWHGRRRNGKMASTIGTAYVQIEPSFKGAVSKIDKEFGAAGEKSGNTFGQGFGKVVGTVGKTVASAVAAGTAAMGAFAKSSVEAGMQFDSSMSQVAATMGVTVDEISGLRDFAQEMGSTTAFSATQAADALNYMALAGYDAETSMKMLPNVLNLAAAGGIDLAYASDMVTDASSALGLEIEQTTALVDQMAAASSKSNTSVAQLGEAILTVGGTAKTLKGGTTELSTALGILADNGVKGAEGGTALRNILLSLQTPTDKAAKQLDLLGVKVFDDQGKMKDLQVIMEEFNGALDGMSDQQRQNALNNIFNKVDLKSVNALLDTTSKRWDELGSAISNSGNAAQTMADTQLNNLTGDITLFKSALEGAQIAISDKVTPTLREFVNIGSEGLSRLTENIKTEGFAGALEKLGPEIATAFSSIIEKILPGLLKAGVSIIQGLGQGILQAIPQLMPTITSVIVQLSQMIIQMLPQLLTVGVQILQSLGQGIIDALPTLIPMIAEVVIELVSILTDPGNLQMIIESAVQIILALADGLLQAIPMLIAAIPQVITSIITALTNPDTISTLIQGAISLVTSVTQNLPTIIQALVEAIPQVIEALTTALTNPESLATLIEGFIQLFIALAAAFPEITMALIEAVPQVIMALVQAFMQLGPALKDSITQACVIAGPSFDQLATFAKDSWAKIQAAFAQAGTWFGNRFKEAVSAVKNAWSGIQSYFKGIWEQICSVFSDALSRFSNIGKNIVGGIKDGIANAWESLTEWFSEKIGGLLDTAEEVLDIESPSKKFRDEVGRWIPAGIAVGIEEGMGVLKKTTAAMSNDILDTATMNLQVGSAFSASVPDINTSSDNSNTMAILAEYLPIIAREISKPIEVNQNDRGTFEAVRRQNNVMVTSTGYHALA